MWWLCNYEPFFFPAKFPPSFTKKDPVNRIEPNFFFFFLVSTEAFFYLKLIIDNYCNWRVFYTSSSSLGFSQIFSVSRPPTSPFPPPSPTKKKVPKENIRYGRGERFYVLLLFFSEKEKKKNKRCRGFGCLHFACLRFAFLRRGNAGLTYLIT